MSAKTWMTWGALYAVLAGSLVFTTHKEMGAEIEALQAAAAKAAKAKADTAQAELEATATEAAAETAKAVAKRPIRKGGLVTAAMLDKAGAAELKRLEGGYARRDIASGGRVKAGDVLFGPQLAALPGAIWIGLPVERAHVESGHIDVGLVAAVCAAGGFAAAVPVGAVTCADAKSAHCAAFLRIDADKVELARVWLQSGAEVAPSCS